VPASFLVSIREDAYTKLDRFKGRIPNLFGNYVHLDHLTATAARTAIQGPLNRWSARNPGQPVTIEPALVDAVLIKCATGRVLLEGRGAVSSPYRALLEGHAQIEAPYLQLVMTRLWE